MKSPTFSDSQGRPVMLGRCLGRGGEGAVYSVAGNEGLAAKIHTRRPDGATVRKLQAMVALCTPALRETCAWPVDLLFGERRQPLGFLMPVVNDHHELHELYGPADRRRAFPDATWAFLVRAARNLAVAFETVHAHGHLIGDVNQGNAVVSQSATVRLIDCDSFQVSQRGEVFGCRVGVPLFTPPELQGCNFDDVLRTKDHDAFGLAALIFHLLFLGRHPFAGRHPQRTLTLEEAICEGSFVYGRTAGAQGWVAPPFALQLGEVTPEIAALLESALGPRAARGRARPSAQQWASALAALEATIVRCTTDPQHLFLRTAGGCPWCRIEDEGGPFFFSLPTQAANSAARRLAARLWRDVRDVPDPGPPPPIPPLPTAPATTPPLVRWLQSYSAWRCLAVAASLVLTWILFRGGIGLGVLALVPVIFLAGRSSCDEGAERTRLGKILTEREATVRRIEERWKGACDDSAFHRFRASLAKPRSRLQQLHSLRRRRWQELPAHLAQECLTRHLKEVVISDHCLPGLEPADLIMLASLGIRTADRLYPAVLAGIPALTRDEQERLIAWRREVEEAFVADQASGLSEAQRQVLDAAIRDREEALVRSLSEGLRTLTAHREGVLERRAAIAAEIDKAHLQVVEARVQLAQA